MDLRNNLAFLYLGVGYLAYWVFTVLSRQGAALKAGKFRVEMDNIVVRQITAY
jgi:hypothetical protein